jgi:predicted O-methyltransferase YrrM
VTSAADILASGTGWRMVPVNGGNPIPTSITPAEAAALASLAVGRTLEVGSAFGYSAVVMARAGAPFVLSIDTHQMASDSLAIMQSNLRAYNVTGRVGIVVGQSQDLMPALIACGARFDLVFVDGDHSEVALRSDVRYAMRLLGSGGVLACHDYGYDAWPAVKGVLDECFPAGPDRLIDSLWVHRSDATAPGVNL